MLFKFFIFGLTGLKVTMTTNNFFFKISCYRSQKEKAGEKPFNFNKTQSNPRSEKTTEQAGFAEPHSSLTIGWVGLVWS